MTLSRRRGHCPLGQDGSQEVGPNASAATGSAVLTYDDVTNLLDIEVTVTGLFQADLADLELIGGQANPFHIHAAPPGANGGIFVILGQKTDWVDTVTGMTLSLSGISVPEGSPGETDLLGANSYLNLHTLTFAGGEIRGNIPIPEPNAALLIAIGGLLVSAVGRRRG